MRGGRARLGGHKVQGRSYSTCLLTSRGLYLIIHKATPAEMINPSQESEQLKDSILYRLYRDCILTSCGLELLRSPLDWRKSKARRLYSARKELCTDLASNVSLKATPAEMINPSHESVHLKDNAGPIVLTS
jgi:hypothetical protein